jgi:hypothetical protein
VIARSRYALLVIYVSMFVFTLSSILYANHVAAATGRHFCSLVTTLDDAYRGQPPTTPTGKRLAADVARLRRDLRC